MGRISGVLSMKIKSLEFDGTPEEFAQVGHLFAGQPGTPPAAPLSQPQASPEPSAVGGGEPEAKVELNGELVLRLFNRRPLSQNIRKVFKAFLAAGDKKLTTTDLATAVGITRQELAGVFGAFGRRVAHTAGWPDGLAFVGWERNDDDEYVYWLPPVVRQVLESGKVQL
jgi:hypothetical protein